MKIGDNVFVGDGLRKYRDEATIFRYSLIHATWSRLPSCPTRQHGLATLDDELIVIGGITSDQPLNTVYTFRDDNWQQTLPPMPTPRSLLSSASYDNKFVIAAGGIVSDNSKGETVRTDIVEIYARDSGWYSTEPLPFSLAQFTLQVIGDKCYTLGGVTDDYGNSSTVLYATMSSLLVPAKGKYPHSSLFEAKWKRLRDKHPLTFPCLVELDGRLVAMGGSAAQQQRHGTKFISTYDSETDTWVECKGAQLPLALYRPGLVNLGSNKVMLIGGQPRSQRFSAVAFIGSYY